PRRRGAVPRDLGALAGLTRQSSRIFDPPRVDVNPAVRPARTKRDGARRLTAERTGGPGRPQEHSPRSHLPVLSFFEPGLRAGGRGDGGIAPPRLRFPGASGTRP